jgi:hypothetical protein
MGGDATAPSPAPSKPLSPPRRAAPSKKARARKGKPEPIPIVYDGQIFPSRGAAAKHLARILGKSPSTLTRALGAIRKESLVPR